MRHPFAVSLFAFLLALASGAIGDRLFISQEPASLSAQNERNLSLIGEFYSTVNTALASGETSGLDGIVDSAVAEYPTRDAAGGLASLKARLIGLHATVPELRLTVEDAWAFADRVAVRVRFEGAGDGAFLGVPLGSDWASWGSFDIFRIADHRISEHWGTPTNFGEFTQIASGPLPLDQTSRRTPALDERTYDPATRGSEEVALGPVSLLIQSGTLNVVVTDIPSGSADFVHNGQPGRRAGRESLYPYQTATIVPGDLLLLPAGTSFAIENNEDSAATLLVLTLTSPIDPGGAATLPLPGHPGVAIRNLAWGGTDVLAESSNIAFGMITLGPGAGIALHTVSGPELLVVQSGVIRVLVNGSPAWISHGDGAGASREPMTEMGSGSGALIVSGGFAEYRNTGSVPVRLLMVTIT